jgi:hypothetical protein
MASTSHWIRSHIIDQRAHFHDTGSVQSPRILISIRHPDYYFPGIQSRGMLCCWYVGVGPFLLERWSTLRYGFVAGS